MSHYRGQDRVASKFLFYKRSCSSDQTKTNFWLENGKMKNMCTYVPFQKYGTCHLVFCKTTSHHLHWLEVRKRCSTRSLILLRSPISASMPFKVLVRERVKGVRARARERERERERKEDQNMYLISHVPRTRCRHALLFSTRIMVLELHNKNNTNWMVILVKGNQILK